MSTSVQGIGSLVGDELLVAVFKHFPTSGNLRFQDESLIMRAFYKASKKPEYKTLFRNYHFDEDGVVPYSRDIADALDILHRSGLMSKLNPSYVDYQLSPAVEVRYKYVSEKLSSDQESLLNQLATEIKDLLEV